MGTFWISRIGGNLRKGRGEYDPLINYTNRILNSSSLFSAGGLLEIGKNMVNLTGHEKVFYFDQQTTR